MSMRYAVRWRSKATGATGGGTKTWSREEAGDVVRALDALSGGGILHYPVTVPTEEDYWAGEIPNLEKEESGDEERH